MRARCAFLLAPVLGLLDCGSITIPVSTTPTNTCALGSSCAEYCSGMAGCVASQLTCAPTLAGDACLSCPAVSPACQGTTLPNFVLLVNVPEGAAFTSGRGMTFPLQTGDVNCAVRGNCAETGGAAGSCITKDGTYDCLQLPKVSLVSGAYIVDGVLGKYVSPPETPTTIPALTTFIPMWPPCTQADEVKGACPIASEAATLNLPLPNVAATTTADAMDTTIQEYLNLGGIVGPNSPVPIGWFGFLPSLPGSNFVAVQPLSPYDALVPPLTESTSPVAPVNLANPLSYEVIPPPTMPGSLSYDGPITLTNVDATTGWTVYEEEVNPPQRIVSSISTIVDNQGTLISFADTPTNLIVAPPSSRHMPSLVQPVGVAISNQKIPYPSVPSPVSVSGSVVDQDGHALQATLHLVGTGLLDIEPVTGECRPTFASALKYDVLISTNSDGLFQDLELPQGTYAVTIDPLVGGMGSTSAAKSTVPLDVQSKQCPGGGTIRDQLLKASSLVSLGNVQVAIADGRPLANAEVDFTPAGALLTSSMTGEPLAVEDWPRPFTVTTDKSGSFSVALDPGPYDITVRPAAGTNLPWIVYPAFQIMNPLQTLPKLVVPAPALLGPLTIHGPDDSPVADAVVRAFLFTSCPMGGASTCLGPAVQIGNALTDSNGTFEMFLAPNPVPTN
jgi:hypothetical protein